VAPTPKETAADKEMRDAFKKIAGEDMEVDAYELQDILNASFKRGFFCFSTLTL
jgi:hypothetical protein